MRVSLAVVQLTRSRLVDPDGERRLDNVDRSKCSHVALELKVVKTRQQAIRWTKQQFSLATSEEWMRNSAIA